MRAPACVAVAAALLCTSTPANADKAACIASAERAQPLRKSGQLKQARDELTKCAADECPAVVRDDCARWLQEVDSAIPTIVIGAVDGDGHDLVDIRVSVDGVDEAQTLDGRPIALNPGQHMLRCESSGSPAVEQEIVVITGEKNRAVRVQIGKTPVPQALPAPTVVAPTPPAAVAPFPASSSRMSAGVYFAGATGLVALAVSGVSYGIGVSSYLSLSGSCKPHCAPSDVEALRTQLRVGDVAGAITVASLAAAAYVYLSSPRTSGERSARLGVAPAIGGGVVRFDAAW